MIKKLLAITVCVCALAFSCQKSAAPTSGEQKDRDTTVTPPADTSVTPPADSSEIVPEEDSTEVVPVIPAIEDRVDDFKSGYRKFNVTVTDAGTNQLTAEWTGVVDNVKCTALGGGEFLVKYNLNKNEGKTDLEGSITLSCGPAEPVTFKVIQKCDAMRFHVPGVIAHRGFHNEERPENSIAALKAAQELGVYGVELDVWYSTDNVLFVNHDGYISGCSVPDCDSETLSQVRLDNGEPLPTLDDFIVEAKKVPSVKLIIEIKAHGTEEAIETARLTIAKVRETGMESQCEYISFNYDACKYIKSECPDAQVALLEKGDRTIADMAAHGINVDFGYWDVTREVQDEARAYGLTINIWTVNEGFSGRRTGCDFITTDLPDEAKRVYDEYLRTL